jgi:broad specificity phosphatase PhoE
MERVLGGVYEGKEYQLAMREAKEEYQRWEFNKKAKRINDKNKGIDIMNARRMKKEFQELMARGEL